MPEPSAAEQPSSESQHTPLAMNELNTPPPISGPATPPAPGRPSRYRVERFHAKGGLGEVHVATDTELDRSVALKRIQGHLANDVLSRNRFLREAALTAKLEHPGIVPVHGLVTDEQGQPCYAMRFVEGDSLAEAIREFHGRSTAESAENRRENQPALSSLRSSAPSAVDYSGVAFRQLLTRFITVCNTIAYAHSRGVLHRDLKPQNIMLGKYGETLVVDWGLAKDLSEPRTPSEPHTPVSGRATTGPYTPPNTPDATQLGEALGTPEYMSPEQAAGRWDVLDHGTDLYSLGATLYELLTGKPPFDRKENWPALQQKIQQGKFVRPRTVNKNVPAALEAVCLKAMAVEPQRRYGSTLELAGDLEHWLADEPVSCYGEPWTTKAGRWARKHRTLVTGAVAALLVAALASMVALFLVENEREHTAKERDAKAAALEAEMEARRLAMTALRDMSDDIVENQMARGTTLTEENKEFLRKIIKHFQGFAAITADDAESRAIRAEGYFRIGLMRHNLGELKEAEADYRAALTILKQLAADFPAEFRQELQACWSPFRLLATSHNNLGNLLSATGRLKDAEAAYADALVIQKQLAADFPNVPEVHADLARSHYNSAKQLQATGRLKEAEAACQDALAIQKQLAADFPTRPEFRQDLVTSHNNLGLLLRVTGRLKEAAAYAEALATYKQLAADFPTHPELREHLAGSHLNLGNLLRDTGRLKEAEAAFQDALAIKQQLAADFPTRPEFRQELATSRNNLGLLLRATGRLEEAHAALADALTLRKQFAADFPKQPDVWNELAGTFVNLALLCNQRRDFKTAKAYLEEGQPHHQAALKINPRNPTYRQYYQNNLLVLAMANAGLQDQAGAVRAAETIRDLGWDAAGDAYDAACALALCIPIVEKDDKSIKEERNKQLQFYGDEAMKMLKDAVAKGYKDAAHMKKDTDLDALRDRDDFQKLLAELEGKGK